MDPFIAGLIIRLLPGRQSELMLLLVEGKDYREIMNVMDLDLPTIKKYRRRIQIKILGYLDEEAFEEIIVSLRRSSEFAQKQRDLSNLKYL